MTSSGLTNISIHCYVVETNFLYKVLSLSEIHCHHLSRTRATCSNCLIVINYLQSNSHYYWTMQDRVTHGKHWHHILYRHIARNNLVGHRHHQKIMIYPRHDRQKIITYPMVITMDSACEYREKVLPVGIASRHCQKALLADIASRHCKDIASSHCQ